MRVGGFPIHVSSVTDDKSSAASWQYYHTSVVATIHDQAQARELARVELSEDLIKLSVGSSKVPYS